MPYAATPVTTANWDAVYLAIHHAVSKAVDKTAIKAFRVARNKVPVREVFKGGSPRFHVLTAADIQGEAKAFRKAFGNKGYGQHTIIHGEKVPARIGVRQVTTRNQANILSRTRESRQVFQDQFSLGLMNPYYERFLNRHGRAEMRLANAAFASGGEAPYRAVIEPQEESRGERALFAAARKAPTGAQQGEKLEYQEKAKLQLGGGLRDSIERVVEDNDPIIKTSIVAGNEHVKYAKYVEFGTRHAPAQPFLRPALAAVRVEYPLAVRAAIHGISH